MPRLTSCCVALFTMICSVALGQTVTINGGAMGLQSSGAVDGSGWTLSQDGYVGTYINLSTPTAVTFTVDASGTMSSGTAPDMTLAIANTTHSFSVSSSSTTANTFTTGTLPAGTYFVRTQLDNQTNTISPDLNIADFKVDGIGVTAGGTWNANSATLALSAGTTYINNFRSGNVSLTINGANGLPIPANIAVAAKLTSNNF